MDDYQFQQHRNLYNTIMYDRDDPLTCQVVRSIHLEGKGTMLNVRVLHAEMSSDCPTHPQVC